MAGLDPDVIAMLRDDMAAEDRARLLDLFQGDVTTALAALDAAMAAGDGKALARAAHRLAGCAGSVGGTALDAMARRLMAEGLAGAPAILPALRTEAAAAIAALKAALA